MYEDLDYFDEEWDAFRDSLYEEKNYRAAIALYADLEEAEGRVNYARLIRKAIAESVDF